MKTNCHANNQTTRQARPNMNTIYAPKYSLRCLVSFFELEPLKCITFMT